MNKLVRYIWVSLLLCACEKEKIEIQDLTASLEEISRIELRADHKMLLPNGQAKMEFYPYVYGKKEVMKYGKTDEEEYMSGLVEEEYLIPSDQLPQGIVKVYDNIGNEIVDNLYSTTSVEPGTVLNFYAKAGDVESNRVSVTIRELPNESYKELVVPVIFHFLIPPTSEGPSYEVSVEYLESMLEEVNNIYNRKLTTDPNGGNAKVTFKLALYDNTGTLLQEPGKHVVKLSLSNMNRIYGYADDNDGELDIAYDLFITRYKSTFFWEPERYLNIWVAHGVGGDNYYDLASYRCDFPRVIHSDYSDESIPGLEDLIMVDHYGLAEVEECQDVGITLNFSSFLAPSDNYSLAGILARYYGVFYTDQDDNDDWVGGDNDYCSDTYSYYSGYSPSVFKNNRLYREDETAEYDYFTSFNVMDNYSRKSSLSVDQVARIRKVMEVCPSRWAYKSNWAFTGQD